MLPKLPVYWALSAIVITLLPVTEGLEAEVDLNDMYIFAAFLAVSAYWKGKENLSHDDEALPLSVDAVAMTVPSSE